MTGKHYLLAVIMVLSAGGSACFGQSDSLTSLTRRFDHYKTNALQEKLFLHTDRSSYLTGETVWFRIYCVDGTFHKPLDLSKVAYVEVLDKDNSPVLQTKVSMADGGGNGSLFLPSSLSSGHYILRAYTQWMRNTAPDFYFQQRITVINAFTKLGLKPHVDKPEYDVQFFPEGGNLVSGLESKVAFRAIGKDGKGIDFRGSIINENNDTITRFHPLRLGIGSFSFTPTADHRYHAVIQDSKNRRILVAFAEVHPEGYVMRVTDTTGNRISVRIRSRFSDGTKPYVHFFAHTRQVTAVAQTHFMERGTTSFLLDKNKLGEGVSHLTVFSGDMVPVCERLYFKPPADILSIDVQSSQPRYATREKIQLSLQSTAVGGQPLSANFSLAVFKADSLDNADPSDIVTSLLLTSDLKGAIESPRSYVVNPGGGEDLQAIDNLMLTHGWSRFRWEDLKRKDVAPAFIPEYGGHLLSGKVVNIETGAPAVGKGTYLSTPGKNIKLYLARSNDAGKVIYEMRDFYGPRRILLQTNTEIDTTSRIEITSPFSDAVAANPFQEFDLSDQLKNTIGRRSLNMQLQNIFFEKNIHFRVPAVDSLAFYGTPDEKYLLDDFTRFPTMEEVMREYVPGVMVRKKKDQFHFLTLDPTNKSLFRDNPLVLLDGVPVFNINKIMNYDPRKIQRLDVITHRYFLGHLSFEGVVSYTTYRGDLRDFEMDPRAFIINYEGLQLEREFYSPKYETDQQRQSRIPDARDLLYWAPSLKTDAQGKLQLEFYSSDVAGKYIVVVQGISPNGQPGMGRSAFEVISRENY